MALADLWDEAEPSMFDQVVPTTPLVPHPRLDVGRAYDRAVQFETGRQYIEYFVADLEEQVAALAKEAHDVGFRRGLREAHADEATRIDAVRPTFLPKEIDG